MRTTTSFRAQMLLGELLLLLIAALDALLRVTKVLKPSVDRPQRPSAEQFAKQQRQQLQRQQQQSRVSAIGSATASSTSTSRLTTRTTTLTATPTEERGLDAVVIGGGAAGVSTAAALSRAGLANVVILEKNQAPGDVWRKRYSTLTLQCQDYELPFVKIPDSLPVYLPAGVFADYLDFHARIHRIDFRGGFEATSVEPLRSSSSSEGENGSSCSSPSSGDRWRVRARPVSEDGDSAAAAPASSPPPSSCCCLEAENVVFCDSELYNTPRIPEFAREAVKARSEGAETEFLGEVLHSSQLSAREGSCARFAGKRVLVVGFGNSAMDVVQELVAVGARSVVIAVRDPSRRAVVPLLAYGAYQEQLAKYQWLLWAEKAATFLESKSVASKGILSKSGGSGDDDGGDGSGLSAAFSPLLLLLAAALSALASLFRSLASAVDQLLDAAMAARCLRAWAALGARGGDFAPYGLSTLPGGKGDCGPVTWTKRTAEVFVMDTGAVKEVIRGNARVVVAAVERLGPGKRAELRPTGAAAAVGVPGSAAASAPAAAAASAGAAPEESEQPRLPSSASPATAALIAAVGGEIPGGEAPVLAPAPRFLDDIDAVILCTGYKPCSSDTL